MADALLGPAVQVLVRTAINSASEQIGQFVGFKNDLKKLQKTLIEIQAVLRDAEKKQVTENYVKIWLEDLERVAFDADNLLDDFNYEMIRRKVEIQNQMKRKVCFFFSVSNPIAFRCRMAKKIQKINMDLTSIHERRTKLGLLRSQNGARDAPAFMESRETDSVTTDTVGRDDNVSAIVTELTATSNNETISVLPIVGMGGIGKTTVARKVFHDLNIENHFDERMWVCVSGFEKHFDANRLFGLMLESLKVPMPEVASKEAKVQKLKEILDGKEPNGKKYLLVLDDVWSEDPAPWDGFLDSLRGISSAKGSWILVTTRNEQVATITAISSRPCSLEELSDYDCWLILEKKAFGSREAPDDLKELGLELAKKCQGLPLAASVLGGMLRNKGSDVWHSILDTGLQNIGGNRNDYINKILKLSFDHLPYPSLKKCFAYCSIFPRGFEMERNQLIQLWAAEGFLHSNPRNKMCMEEVGKLYFNILLDSNLFQDAEKDGYGNVLNCKMHDLVHGMVQSISDSKTLRLTESGSVHMETASIRYLALERSEKEMPFPSTESFKRVTTLFLQGSRSLNDREMSFFMLRTLRVKYCDSLTKFPKNFKNLVNLRHFDFFSEDKSSDIMPFEIGQLQFLQTLPFFNIGEERGQQIGELRNLKNLSGQLELCNLELVKSKEEAESANLIGKPNIDELRLLWNEIDNSKNNDSEYNQVLEGLHPHPNLKGVIIERFFGDQLSTWIGELGRLVKFKLQNCKNCKELPTFGNMPFLRSLHLKGLDSLTSIGPSFYGRSGVHSGSTSQRPLNLFPALEDLILENMQNLREWTEATVHDGTMVVFPVLHTDQITNQWLSTLVLTIMLLNIWLVLSP
ncbi:putative disease resistance protein RGA3 [Coffea eugenioides]|uniref:putative disease resistance protein RGA3 n=1 Tax=Coffea eugenioides TaxID=49369 RepID=UPI000F60CBE4|nr:putative disease resistance protein RGA3 [Coffea eugenioides]